MQYMYHKAMQASLQNVDIVVETNLDSHFKYVYTVTPPEWSKKWIKQYRKLLIEQFGNPGRTWGYRVDYNFNALALHFANEKDAAWYKLMAK